MALQLQPDAQIRNIDHKSILTELCTLVLHLKSLYLPFAVNGRFPSVALKARQLALAFD